MPHEEQERAPRALMAPSASAGQSWSGLRQEHARSTCAGRQQNVPLLVACTSAAQARSRRTAWLGLKVEDCSCEPSSSVMPVLSKHRNTCTGSRMLATAS